MGVIIRAILFVLAVALMASVANGQTGIRIPPPGGGGGGTDDQTASEVPIDDTGGFFTAADVEAALAQLGPALQCTDVQVVGGTPGGNGLQCQADDTGSDDQLAPEVGYTPTTGTDWVDPDPADVGEGLDDLAGRLTVDEAALGTHEANASAHHTKTIDASELTAGLIPAERVGAAHVDVITEIAAALKSGLDLTLITGTPGSPGNCAEWNLDGDVVDHGAPCSVGTLGDSIEVEDGDDSGSYTVVDPTAQFDDGGDIDFQLTVGVGPLPDQIVGVVRAGSVALGADTTGGYAASTTEGGGATSLEAAALDAIAEIDSTLKSGLDSTLVTGTAGAAGNCVEWNGDGDAVDSGAACGSSSGIGGSVGASDNRIPRSDGTGGSTLQAGLPEINDAGQILVHQTAFLTPSISGIGDTDTGFHIGRSANDIEVVLGGIRRWYWLNNNLRVGNTARGAFMVAEDGHVAATPAYATSFDQNTGWRPNSTGDSDKGNLVAGGSDSLEWSTTYVKVQRDLLKLKPVATAPATCVAAEDLYSDTSGALCFCTSTNTWTNVSGVGSCT